MVSLVPVTSAASLSQGPIWPAPWEGQAAELRADQSHLLSTGQGSTVPEGFPASCLFCRALHNAGPIQALAVDRLGMELPGVSGSLVLATSRLRCGT